MAGGHQPPGSKGTTPVTFPELLQAHRGRSCPWGPFRGRGAEGTLWGRGERRGLGDNPRPPQFDCWSQSNHKSPRRQSTKIGDLALLLGAWLMPCGAVTSRTGDKSLAGQEGILTPVCF